MSPDDGPDQEPRLTRRQEIQRMLEDAVYGFEELREVLRVPVKVLEEDLRHLDKSLRRGPRRLRVAPARCVDCGFVSKVRPGRFATPSRCPSCRGRHLEPPRLEIG